MKRPKHVVEENYVKTP